MAKLTLEEALEIFPYPYILYPVFLSKAPSIGSMVTVLKDKNLTEYKVEEIERRGNEIWVKLDIRKHKPWLVNDRERGSSLVVHQRADRVKLSSGKLCCRISYKMLCSIMADCIRKSNYEQFNLNLGLDVIGSNRKWFLSRPSVIL